MYSIKKFSNIISWIKCYFKYLSIGNALVLSICHFYPNNVFLNKKKNQYILNYMDKLYGDKVRSEQYFQKIEGIGSYDNKIWFFWWQGEANMPHIVRECYKSACVHRGKREVVFLDKNTVSQYAVIPEKLNCLVGENKIRIATYSDVLRAYLLSAYKGGVWLDATVFLTVDLDEIPELNLGLDFFSIKHIRDEKFVSQFRWSTWFMVSNENNICCSFLYNYLCDYFEDHDDIIDYLMPDVCLRSGYEYNAVIREHIDKIPMTNPNCFSLMENMNEIFDKDVWKVIQQDTNVFKLSYKKSFKDFVLNKGTFYHCLPNLY